MVGCPGVIVVLGTRSGAIGVGCCFLVDRKFYIVVANVVW